MARKRLDPFETEITHLGAKGLGMGLAPDGAAVKVRGAVPGTRVAVTPAGKRKGEWTGRKTATIRPAPDGVEPRCAVFGMCGGCMLQEGSLASQRYHKGQQALREVEEGLGSLEGVVVHEVRGAPAAYGYRNRIEMSFGPRRWLNEADQVAGLPQFGAFLGMHPPGRFDRVVDSPRCELVSEPMNALLAHVRAVALAEGAPPCRDVHSHEGFWRHVRLREGHHTAERLVILFTATPKADEETWVAAIAERVASEAVGVVWCVDDGIADVARGEVLKVWGRDSLTEELRPEGLRAATFQLSATSFFQTNTPGAEVLYATIGEAMGRGERLLDLYCGTGSIGIALADRFSEVVGIEEVEAAVVDAQANAAANGVVATYRCAKVEDALDSLGGGAHIVVDPPRAGLHPKVAKHLAKIDAESLVYVACKAGSLGRDGAFLAEGGWRLKELWIVDLFPQTGHIELVGRFERS
jgi:23S rRNA (uracil1939-C5)-methyltransferase